MSSNFLQRFKGKTQIISKQGVHNLLGGNNKDNVQIYTHSNGIPMSQKANTSKTSNMSMNINKKNNTDEVNNKKKQSLPKAQMQNGNKTKNSLNNFNMKQKQRQKQHHQTNQNPFLISNPFYLDQQQRIRQQQQRKQQQKQQRLLLQQMKRNKQKQDIKKGTSYSSSMSKKNNNQTKKSQKQWVKLGGLGPNIGGEQWQQKRKKLQKMQQFASQVKAINTQKVKTNKPPMPNARHDQKKDNPRTKAIQYSKNVPKPVIKQYEHHEQQYQTQQPIKEINQNQMTQLQMYQLKHKQLKEMLKKDF